MQVHVSGAVARRVRFVYGELSAVSLQCDFYVCGCCFQAIVWHECTFVAISAWSIRVQRLLLLRARRHAASLSGELHEVQSEILQLDL